MNTEFFIGLAVAINRAVEVLKLLVLERILAGDARAELRASIALVASLLVGVVVAWVLGANLFTDLGTIPMWAGVVVTGLLVGSGSNAVHTAIEIMTQLRDLLGARVNVVQGEARTVKSETITTQTVSASAPALTPKLYVPTDEAAG